MTQIMHVNGKFTDMFKYLIKGTYVHELTNICSPTHEANFVASRTYVLQKLLFLVVLMTLGVGETLAQDPGYSGVYYIGSRGYNKANTATNYYLCPTEGWAFYKATNGVQGTDNGQPFLTTYQCRNGVYDAAKAVWIVEKEPTSGCYYIKQALTGKYIVSNGVLPGAANTRARVHLETVADAAALTALGDLALFEINYDNDHYDILPHSDDGRDGNNKYLVVNTNNYPQLDGNKAKTNGPTGFKNCAGIIGLYTHPDDGNAYFYFEEAVLPPTFTVNVDGSVEMSAASGYEVRYTTNNDTPTASSTLYGGTALSHDAIKDYTGSAIKAVAVKSDDNTKVSNVVALPLVNYTYNVVNSHYDIAIKYTIKEAVGKRLRSGIADEDLNNITDGWEDIPEAIRSMYIRKERITFKSFEGTLTEEALDKAEALSATPSTPNIYITYTTNHLKDEIISLRAARMMNVKAGENGSFDNIYDSGSEGSGVLAHDAITVTDTNQEHFWLIGGNDPYAVTIRNAATHNYLHYETSPSPALSLSSSSSYFIVMAGSAAGDVANRTYEQMELMPATGGTTYYRVSRSGDIFSITTPTNHEDALQIRSYPHASPVTYHLIDRAGKKIGTATSQTGELRLPNALWSPLVSTYHYWHEASFNVSDGTYTLKSAQVEANDISEFTSEDVYVTYDVGDVIDIQGGRTYLMKFSDGVNFYPEDGNNGVSGTEIKPVYPYNNGDFNLYIYGADEWTKQLSNGASTRTRWLWYFVSNHDGTDLTDDAIDPYHIIVKSRQNQSYKVGSNSYDGNAYLYTFKHGVDVVTGVITQHDVVKIQDPTLKPTEYMLLGTGFKNMVLKTVNEIDGAQQTVNKFEQYWKNYPTVETVAGVANPAADNDKLAAKGWHRYQDWAYAEPWGGGTKTLEKGDHWFQTVSMGSGVFSIEEMTLEPEVILLDQHGWEIVRVPMSQKAKLKQYDSPMVETYHWYPTAAKVTGYHKYTVSNQEITVYDADGKPTTVEPLTYTHNSTSLADIPYNHYPINNQIAKVKTDFYVTYTVKSDYASTYVGAASEEGVEASSFLLKQGGKYAQNTNNTITLADAPSFTGSTVPEDIQWKVKPNFNIDEEMGYVYGSGENSKSSIEAAYHDAGKNGFDPYNVQIQSVSSTARYFTVDTKSTVLDHSIWTGTGSTTISLREMSEGHISATGHDQTTLDITNATFMVVDDGNGNMRLMPRFDNTVVMTNFSTLTAPLPAAAVGNAGEGTQSLVFSMTPIFIDSTDEILSMNGFYILKEGFSLNTSIGTKAKPFEGTIDGQLNHYAFNKPLVLYANGATIRNIILDNIGNLTSGNTEHHLGAIACTAQGNTRIYNCGVLAGSLNETGHVGGIVGHLEGSARVINCYSYANITGGTDVGGIVGYNYVASTASNLKTMVMNCAFYGDITGGGTKSPVYGGYNIANTSGGLNNYNYYAYAQLPSDHLTNDKYNTALAVADEDFQRFEFYRLLLNSNRRLAAYYITGRATDADIMAKWVLETADRSITSPATPKPYPVLKQQANYPSIINYDVSENVPDSASVGRNKGGKLGKTLTVHLSGTGITTTSLTIDRTDKDFDRYNFNYDKIQLPYFNDVGTGNYTNNQVVTGWEITSMTGGTAGTYETGDKWNGYNFADRNCTSKDLVGTSGRIFSQGAYFDVPYGVTDIYIQPHWAKAAYVADEYLDVVYASDYAKHPVTELGNSFKQFPTGKITINDSEQVVHKTIDDAIATFSKGSVYDYAVVLVGNLHQSDVPLGDDTKRFTMMSADLDNDHEPDYSMIYHHTGRLRVCPIRFDFLNVIGTAYAQKPNGATLLKNTTIFKTSGWFEVTNTALMYSNQMEYENTESNVKENAPLILLGGKFDQFVSSQRNVVNGKTIYIHVGGNVWIDQFGPGTHSDGSKSTAHVPVSVTGGEYKGFYLTGTYNQDAEVRTDNAECYISGGHFVEAAGACQEAINGDVHWQIYNADIDAFYGGGINAARPIKGHVTTEITNSYVTTFCGGPKFGDMQTGKDVRTTATGCVFERYYGAGFGGTSYSRKKYHDNTSYNFTNLAKYYKDGDNGDRGKYFDGQTTNSRSGGTGDAQYGKKGVGVATDFDYEFFVWSSGQTGARFFVKFASFSLANCIDVYSTLNNCTINQNFYGGGSFGSVSGTATSELNGCTVHGNVFGGGYSATREKVPVRNSGFANIPKYNSQSGMFEPGTFSGTTEYEWKQHALPANGTTGIEDAAGDKHYIYTDVDLNALGKVGNTVLTIQGETVVEGKIFQYDSNGKVVKDGSGNNVVLETTGGVFGGGDESAVNHSTQVTVEETEVDAVHKKPVVLNVFGGGNTADVVENTMVTITGGTIGNGDASDTNGNVYGGGKGASTVVGGDVTVNLGTKTGEAPSFTYTGDGLVKHNVYGGSALGSVNTTLNASSEYDKTTHVYIYKGTVNGSVFGGGLGHDDEDDTKDVVAKNYGNTTVTIENSTNANANVKTAVYGGANENGVMKANTTVTITGGTVGTDSNPVTNTVFGGGFGQPTRVEGSVTVNVGLSDQAGDGAVVNGHVYGGGALGNTNVDSSGNSTANANTEVNLIKGTINGNVFGGGLGQKAKDAQTLVLYADVDEYNTAKGTSLTAEQFAALSEAEKTKTPASDAESAVAAIVGGDVTVILNGAKLKYDGNETPLTGQIFGANNLNGTPKGHVKVWVKKTVNVDPAKDALKSNSSTPRDERTTYDVSAVYGGGNQADYIPADPTPETPLNDTEDYAEVIIDGCDDTSIEYVYGGGNAAAVPASDVKILGSYIIDYVFGGGNGKSTATFTNPGANVGSFNNGATSYGSGKAVTKLVGCHAHYVFGGSNTKGNVREGTSILMPDKSLYPAPDYDCCNVRDVKEIYGAGNEAEQDGSVTLILGCVHNMKNVYGGARNANVKGGIDLVVTSGSFEGVFGGNDMSGTIQGPITVTIEETGCDPLEIDNLYLGGNQAAYSIYGYKSDGTARNKDEYDALTDEQKTAEHLPYSDPVLNVVSCTRIGKTSGEDLGGAFGGGLGNGAVMYGSPTVNINMIPGKYAKDIDRDGTSGPDNNANALGTITNVYGGGKEANVKGNTAVNINTVEKKAHRTNMGAEIPVGDRVQKDVLPAIITNNVFGAGKGLADNVNSALVTGNTTITMGGGSVAKSVYGGGELSQVGGNTNIIVRGGEIGDETGANGGETYGNVYGGGKGNTTNVRSGLVKGNTNITIENRVADEDYHTAHPETAVGAVLSSPSIYHNIYGGGAHGSVGTYSYASEADGAAINGYTSGGAATITITGGTIGVNGHDNGMVFGASRGDVGAPESIYDNVAWVYSTNVVIGTDGQGSNHTSPHVKGSVYGGGENGHVYQNASLTIHSGMVGIAEDSPITDNNGTPEDPSDDIIYTGAEYPYRGNVYGGGCGTDKYDNNTKYNPKSGYVGGTASVTIDGGHVVRDVYGAGSMGSVDGSTSVTIAGNAEIGADGSGGGYVFAAARGDAAAPTMATVGSSNLNISGGTIWMDAYGGGQNGAVKGAVTINMTGGTVKHDVYGGGALAQTNTDYNAGSEPANTYITTVTLNGTTINGNLYGGGLGDLSSLGGGHSDIAADVNGPVTVTVSNGKAANVFGCNNLNGAPKQAVAVTVSGTSAVETGSAISNVYGGGNLAAYTGNSTVTVSGGTINNVYGGGLGSTAVVTGSTSVTVSGGTIGNDVYGGGSEADVTGNVAVSVSGGIITNDVYGGGALAQTNTANWDDDGSLEYVVVTGLVGETYRVKDDIVEGASVTGLYTYNGVSYDEATGTAVGGTTYYERLSGAPVAGYYTESGGVYTKLTTGTANGETTYYKKQVKGTWVTPAPINGTDYYTTTVSLTGGLIGNAYGGGLGRQESGTYGLEGYVAPVAANVYGDVTVTVNEGVSATSGVTFVQRIEHPIIDGVDYPTPTSGRVFGCNNHNGTPTGNVTVHVYSTRQIDASNHIIPGHGSSDRQYTYEIQSVYGGGNQADYLPASSKKSQVIIEGCEDTSIEKVYGGGNSAVVPETNVTIYGAYDIGYAFGGGNGDKPIKKADGIWYENEGAIVIGMARVTCHGGKIGQVFGGGDAKGSCGNTNAVTAELESTDPKYCPLHITRLYGAGNKGDVAAVNIVLAACSGQAIEYVHGGSYNAHVAGDVHLTITSGILKNVYGGNDARGGIGGNIIVDIEETNGCNPIIIQNLVGGGNEAPYPGTYKNGSGEEVPYDKRGNITVNVKSATRIDNIYGGSFMAEANADTQVNINMIKGNKAGTTVEIPKEFSYIPNISSITELDSKTIRCLINDSIGTIGNVFGGGNQGVVKGKTAVNISSSDKVSIMQRDGSGKIKVAEGGVIDAENGSNIEGKTILYDDDVDVLGAHITGSVYGGGHLADVTIDSTKVDDKWVKYGGNTEVNICAKESSTPGTYEAVAEGTDKVIIRGSVFGGGKGAADSFQCEKAMVGKDGDNNGGDYGDKGTHVRIGNGTICGTVYGGGEVGRVEFDTKVTIGFGAGTGGTKSPIIYGYVYGAGQGVATHGYSGLVRGNSTVTIQGDAKVGHSVYGAGKLASLGRYWIATTPADTAKYHVELGMPYGLKSGGKSTVVIQGYAEIGPNDMTMPTFDGNVFGAGKGVLAYTDVTEEGPGRYYMGASGYTWESYAGAEKEDAYIKYAKTLGITQATDVTVAGNAFIKGSVYGGSENGRVRDTTLVKIKDDCQIGNGQGINERYTVHYGSWPTDATGIVTSWAECASWDYGQAATAEKKYQSYDRYQNPTADDGHTFYGNVFGGGSGYFPYKSGKWNPDAGVVGGSTKVLITGGHILTCIYGGNELTDVKGKCTITMSGGTLGVPRTLEDIAKHPVTCYLFGAGKGDQRTHFNTWTNVQETEVNVTGGIIYGSVFGGGEDGHVLGDTQVNISGTAKIGTWGTSYVDGNVFGGGRGFSGEALTAGTVGGNTDVNITGGTMLGSVYGGGRLASVGLFFTDPNDNKYGQLHEDAGGNTYGHITVNIKGGTIGKAGVTGDGAEHSGNVFGGSMGRLKLLDNTTFNPMWPELAQAKETNINITGGTITRNVYGGAEFGTVRENAAVTVSDGTVSGNVFGGGYGSDDHEHVTPITVQWDGGQMHYVYTPMQWAGMVGGNTTVSVSGGTVEKNVYGGGELASVGIIDYSVKEDADGPFTINGTRYSYKTIVKHTDLTKSFALSWPYKFEYVSNKPDSEEKGGKATVTITGGHVGTALQEDVQGYVYGGGMGKAMERYKEAFCANVRETEVNIHYSTTPALGSPDIFGAVYGGGENGHVYENTKVDITGGLIGMSVYAGGKGKDKYHVKRADEQLKDFKTNEFIDGDIYSITAGKVYGNTRLTMSGGHVTRSVYGGGFMASVGKGNYAGGDDDYSKFGDKCGYGEAIEGNLWDGVSANSQAFLGSGKATITITGGTIGTADGVYGDLPTGNVVGGSRGEAAPNVFNQPVHLYNPTFHVGNINEAEIIIGTKDQATDPTTAGQSGQAPRIYASVYGGGQDGHMRRDAKITIYSGEIGNKYTDEDQSDLQWQHRGNVFGSGSGIGKFVFDYDGDGTTYTDTNGNGKYDTGESDTYSYDSNGDGTPETHTDVGLSFLAGCVARFSEVDIQGGIIHRNVYGGGSVAGTGMPKFYGQDYEPYKKGDNVQGKQSMNIVTISGGTIGQEGYGGNVFGASRGEAELVAVENPMFATAIWTEVNIKGGTIAGNVYGGGELGSVKKDTKVSLTGGEIKHNAYGGGKGIKADVGAVEANIGGNTTVELNKDVASSAKGCIVQRIFGCNDQNGTPKGHVLVHVYATQHKGTDKIVPAGGKYTKFNKLSEYTMSNYKADTNPADLKSLATAVGLTSGEVAAYEDAIADAVGADAQKAAIDNYIEGIATKKYDVLAVYGGGDLAPYVPTDPTPGTPLNDTEEYAEVIIEGCDLTSIKQVYGGSNAASVPATKLTINSAYEIHESFGGGNGKDNYELDTKWYENPGANIGYSATYHHNTSSGGTQGSPYAAVQNNGSDGYADATTKEARIENYAYGEGRARIEVYGGRIHRSYGGSNERGNIRYEASSAYEEIGECPMIIDQTYGGGKNAETDADIRTDMKCVDYAAELYGGSTNGDVNSNIVLNITNGTFGKVFGGNQVHGRIFGSITVNVKETGCKPIIIDKLYIGGDQAHYSIYGYSGPGNETARTKKDYDDLTDEEKADVTVQKDPRLNIISATRINNVYGGGFEARVVGSPHINVNMEEGTLLAKYMLPEYLTTDQTDTNIPGTTVKWRCRENPKVVELGHDGILPIGTIGNIYGGGDQALVDGSTTIEIGTGKHHNDEGVEEVLDPARSAAYITGRVYGGGNLGDVSGNATIEMGNGYVADRIYGGGKEGHVGTISTRNDAGKPIAFKENTGKTTVTISGGHVGPFEYSHLTGDEARAKVTITPMTMPQDFGYVFGGGRGELVNPATDPDINNKTYVNETEVTIKNGYVAGHDGEAEYITRPLIAGGVYGGSENGRVLRNTHVNIRGGQIGLGAGQTTAYAEADFIDPTTATAEEIATKAAAMPECAHWNYGSPWLPYDEHAGNGHYQTATYGPASDTGSDGHTFYGNVFGGGSGYFAYETATTGVYEWLPSAGLVEGDTYVNISGGHILTNVYGGNELTNVTGTAHVTMTGGTLGVPRTLAQIAAHPVTCYLFGGGKGDQRVHFNMSTNVGHAVVNISGGIIYGSVFGGGEDGHVLGNVTMNIGTAAVGTEGQEGYVAAAGPTIGTWGTSYVEGNVFGGGRGFAGDALTAGVVCGNVDMNIKGGTMLGSIYGGGRLGSIGTHLEPSDNANYGKLIPDDRDEDYKTGADYTHSGSTHGYVTVNISGGTIGNNREYIIPNATNIAAAGIAETDISKWKPESEDGSEWTTWKTYHHVPSTTYDASDGKLHHTRGGNVYAGGMGRRENLNGQVISMAREGINWLKLGNVKSTKLTITGGTIKSNVYGGGEYGAVQGNHKVLDGEGNPIVVNEKNVVAGTEIIITGGTIGSEILGNSASDVKYTYGSVFGGGTGTTDDVAMTDPVIKADTLGAYVADSTRITLTNAIVKASVFGGGELSAVGGSTNVNISGTTAIGRNEVRPKSDPNPGYVMFGSWRMGNVYGGGRGSEKAAIAGLVKGNTNINISGGNVYHMVYGGGALGSVGDFKISDGAGNPSYIPIAGIPYDWKYTDGTVIDPANPDAKKTPTGTATVTITGGTIGISGRDNGLVFGSSRGNLKKPETDANEGGKKVDPYDRVAWVNKSVVNIGTKGSGSVYTTPLIKGSVYGGGENGHNADSAIVNIYSGTIGIANTIPGTETADPWWDFENDSLNTVYRGNRGNVFGAGSGSDTYTGDDGKEHYNPKSGMVGRNTVVNIYGGHVGRNVYGGGSMAMVGTITNVNDTISAAKHTSETTSFALSWPYKFEFANNTGKATVNVTGGHIGTLQTDGGDVYGSSRGEAGDRYEMAHLAYTRETEVNINYDSTPELTSDIETNYDIPCITGSVHGSGEDGYVYGDTHVTLDKGLIGHSLYGAGKGKGTYAVTLKKIGDDVNTYPAEIYSLIAGKVMGNTYVTMNGGIVGRNVYGGGNMASVGKGNYAGGADDYFPSGYGESLNGNSNDDDRKLWDSSANANSAAFLSSGKTTVKVLGGKVGILTTETKNQLPYGNVFGGSAGEAAPELPASFTTDRYLYCPAFFSGYVNETDVTIGKKRSEFGSDEEYNTYLTNDAPKIAASVYGGGQDGHVRRDTKVTVNNGEIGLDYDADNQEALGTANINDDQWLARGNVYGGGSGITQYTSTLQYKDGTPEAKKIPTTGYSSSSGSVTRFTEVNVLGGIVHRNVYGGGSLGSVGAPDLGQGYDLYKPGQANIDGKPANGPGRQSQCSVKISGQIGTVLNSRSHYGGDVFGACRGTTSLDATQFGTSIWTNVHILNGATIFGNVFGGGDAGIVKKNAEVVIGE